MGMTVVALSTKDGSTLWQATDDGPSSSIAVEDRFILWGEHGHLAVMKINPKKPDLISMTETPLLKSPCYTAPPFRTASCI